MSFAKGQDLNKYFLIFYQFHIGFLIFSDLSVISDKILDMKIEFLPYIIVLAPLSWIVLFLSLLQLGHFIGSLILYGNPKTRKIVKSDKFQALLAETTAGATAVSVGAEETAASAGAITSAPGAVADGIIEASDGVSEIMGDAPYSTFEPGTGSNAQQISQFVQGLKDFVDFRRLYLILTMMIMPVIYLFLF